MKLGIINITRDEYRKEYLCVRDYKVTFLGIPVYVAKFTSTNNEALRKLTVMKEKTLRVCGFTNNVQK